MCDKVFIWNSSNCECECDKSCDVAEYFDYKNFKCRNKLVDRLVEECFENIDGNKILHNKTLYVIPLNDYKKVCNTCIIYIVLFVISFITGICISSVFIYFHWYLKKENFVLSLILVLKQQFIRNINGKFKQINIENRTYYFFNDIINIKNFDPSLTKMD